MKHSGVLSFCISMYGLCSYVTFYQPYIRLVVLLLLFFSSLISNVLKIREIKTKKKYDVDGEEEVFIVIVQGEFRFHLVYKGSRR